MKRNSKQFKDRFNRWKSGEKVYEAGKPIKQVVVTPDYETGYYDRLHEDDEFKKTYELVDDKTRPNFYKYQKRLPEYSCGKSVKKCDCGKSIRRCDGGKNPEYETYTVKPGDSPWRISHQYGIPLEAFYELNPFARTMIHPNDVVKIKQLQQNTEDEEVFGGVLPEVKVVGNSLLQDNAFGNERPAFTIDPLQISAANSNASKVKPLSKKDDKIVSLVKRQDDDYEGLFKQVVDALEKESVQNFINFGSRQMMSDAIQNMPLLSNEAKADMAGTFMLPTWSDTFQAISNGVNARMSSAMQKARDIFPSSGLDKEQVDFASQGVRNVMDKIKREKQFKQQRELYGNGNVPSTVGDTLYLDKYDMLRNRANPDRQYTISENINLNEVNLGSRNRHPDEQYDENGYKINKKRSL